MSLIEIMASPAMQDLDLGVATSLRTESDGSACLRYHRTDIIVAYPDGRIVLSTGGWWTSTTKKRMNRFLSEIGWYVYQKKHEWYIRTGAEKDTHWKYGELTLQDPNIPEAKLTPMSVSASEIKEHQQ